MSKEKAGIRTAKKGSTALKRSETADAKVIKVEVLKSAYNGLETGLKAKL